MILLLDIGGTYIKYGISEKDKLNLKYLGKIPTKYFEDILDTIYSVINNVLQNYEISAISISTAGTVDSKAGIIVYANENIPGYSGVNLKEILTQKYSVDIYVENDVNCALLGEIYLNENLKSNLVVMYNIGTGIGGALALNGIILSGANGSAGEIGYSIINNESIEENISTTSLVKRVSQRVNNQEVDGEWIFKQAINNNNAICIEEIDHLVTYLSTLIVNTISLLDPSYIVLGGGIMEQKDYLSEVICNKVKSLMTNNYLKDKFKIKFASAGNKAGLIGAYAHFVSSIDY